MPEYHKLRVPAAADRIRYVDAETNRLYEAFASDLSGAVTSAAVAAAVAAMDAAQRAGLGSAGFKPTKGGVALAGSIERATAERASDAVSVREFGVVGDWNGTSGTDDTAALQAAINSGRNLHFPDWMQIRITDALTPTTAGQKFFLGGATIVQDRATDDRPIFYVANTPRVELHGGTLRSRPSGGTTWSIGYNAYSSTAGCDDHKIVGTRFEGFQRAAIDFWCNGSQTYRRPHIERCTIVGPAGVAAGAGFPYGVNLDGSCQDAFIGHNDISLVGIGVSAYNKVERLSIIGCHIHDIPGQHGIYTQNSNGLLIVGNSIYSVNFIGAKVQHDAAGQALDPVNGLSGAMLAGNLIAKCGSHGLLTFNAAGHADTHYVLDTLISTNIVVGVTGSAILISDSRHVLAAENLIREAAEHGYRVEYSQDVVIKGGSIYRVGQCGINFAGDLARCEAENVRIYDYGTLAGPYQNGVRVASSGITDWLRLRGIVARAPTGATTRYGLFWESSDATSLSKLEAYDCWWDNPGGQDVRFVPAGQAVRAWRGQTYADITNAPTSSTLPAPVSV